MFTTVALLVGLFLLGAVATRKAGGILLALKLQAPNKGVWLPRLNYRGTNVSHKSLKGVEGDSTRVYDNMLDNAKSGLPVWDSTQTIAAVTLEWAQKHLGVTLAEIQAHFDSIPDADPRKAYYDVNAVEMVYVSGFGRELTMRDAIADSNGKATYAEQQIPVAIHEYANRAEFYHEQTRENEEKNVGARKTSREDRFRAAMRLVSDGYVLQGPAQLARDLACSYGMALDIMPAVIACRIIPALAERLEKSAPSDRKKWEYSADGYAPLNLFQRADLLGEVKTGEDPEIVTSDGTIVTDSNGEPLRRDLLQGFKTALENLAGKTGAKRKQALQDIDEMATELAPKIERYIAAKIASPGRAPKVDVSAAVKAGNGKFPDGSFGQLLTEAIIDGEYTAFMANYAAVMNAEPESLNSAAIGLHAQEPAQA